MKEQSSLREQAKFSWRILRSRRRILRSPIPNEHPGIIDSQGLLCILTPGGVLRYISDGDVRSPFLGLKFAI